MRITIWVIPLSFVACGLVCGLSCPAGQFRSSVPGRCCNLCPAGHFMSKECQTSANDTQCSPCRSGTYNAKENKDTSCRNCRTSCPDQKETIVKNCSLVSDIQCKCSDNYYRDPHSLQCRKCTSCMKKGQVSVSRCEENKDAVCKACGKGNFLLNNHCVPCDRCRKGEFVVEECSPKRKTVCRKLAKSTRPPSSLHINSQEPVTGTKPVERADLNPTPAEIKAQKRFQDEMWVYRAVIMLLVLIVLGLVLHKKVKICQTIKTKVTTLKKCSGPKVVQRNESQSCREHLLELREKEKHIQNIERQVMELEEQVREKDEQQQNSQSQLTIFRGDGEKDSVNFQKQFHLKLKELADLEKELRDCEQDNVELQRELFTAKEKLSKCESLLTTREWLISRDEIEIMSEKFLGEGGYGKVFIGRYRGFVVAVKALKSLTFTPRERELFEREMDIASRCRHPCLLQFIGATQGESPLFVTELMELSLRKLLGKRRLCGKEITTISLDVAHALNYLHQRKPKAIVHRDVSSANVLLWKQNDQWRGKLGDYGTVKFLQEIMTVDAGAMIYSAPEAGNPYNQTVKIDVYSFGLLFCEMCSGNIPVLESREEQVRLVTNREFGGLILWCIEEDRTMRPSMEEVIKKLEQFQTISSYNCSGAVV